MAKKSCCGDISKYAPFVLVFFLGMVVGVFYMYMRMGVSVLGENTGFDEFGYNYKAMIFNGKADGVDRVLDGKVWGDPYYANDHLVMKWSKAWNDARFNGSAWTSAAWEDNEWNGKVSGGSGEMWHYKIVWDGNCTENCVWGQFKVVMSQGSIGGTHMWDVLTKRNGYGAFK